MVVGSAPALLEMASNAIGASNTTARVANIGTPTTSRTASQGATSATSRPVERGGWVLPTSSPTASTSLSAPWIGAASRMSHRLIPSGGSGGGRGTRNELGGSAPSHCGAGQSPYGALIFSTGEMLLRRIRSGVGFVVFLGKAQACSTIVQRPKDSETSCQSLRSGLVLPMGVSASWLTLEHLMPCHGT